MVPPETRRDDPHLVSMEVERMVAIIEILDYEVDDLESERRSWKGDEELFSKGSRSNFVES